MKQKTSDRSQASAGAYASSSTLVKGRDDENHIWKEQTQLITVARNGAGFYLDRRCEVGRLLSLIIPMPRHLRCYDQELAAYRVWGIIQHCNYLPEKQRFQVGVAFIGRHAPPEYNSDPKSSFRIVGINETGLWKIVAAERQFVQRKHPRFPIAIEVTLATESPDGQTGEPTHSVTEDISARGAAVLSSLDVSVGECVRFTSANPEFSVLAVVHNKRPWNETVSRVSLEFITADFPIRETVSPDETPQ